MKYYTEIVPFELAKKLKEAGFFDTLCISAYASDGKFIKVASDFCCSAPTYADVFDWLIKKGYFVFITPSIDPDDYKVGNIISEWDGWMNADKYARRVSFYEAANAAIEQACEILKENG